MSFPPSFLDMLRDKVPLSTVIGRKVKLTRRGHEYIGLCPFHHEKTASFTINDEKGFYHCFGCGAHGDVVRYLVEAEKLPFLEAVEQLARMAGVKMPEMTREQQRQEVQRTNLTAIMEAACSFFQNQLFGLGGEKAKNYLIKRGISGQVAKQFRLGYAPSGSALTQHLQAKGFDMRECQRLGLIASNRDNDRLHDYFYDRVIFPILDRRKRVIGFGGRMMEKGEPKYLNSPETVLFHKGEQLYALPHAIENIRKQNTAILVEGYMDVIALHSAGFTTAVAPLGTALTESQIKILWQSCDEPLICFDGDAAGQKAAIRALYRALPILVPGKSLRFVSLPNPYDPDDMIRKKSPQAFATLLKEAREFADVLWENLIQTYSADTPERQARLEKEIQTTLSKIQDSQVRTYYQNDFKNRLWRYTHQQRGRKKTRIGVIHAPTPGAQDARMVMAYMLCYPELVGPFLEDIATLHLSDRILESVFQRMTALLLEQPDLTSDSLREQLDEEVFTTLRSEIEMIRKSDRTETEVQAVLAYTIKESRRQILQEEIARQMQLYEQSSSPEVWEKIKDLKKEIENLQENE